MQRGGFVPALGPLSPLGAGCVGRRAACPPIWLCSGGLDAALCTKRHKELGHSGRNSRPKPRRGPVHTAKQQGSDPKSPGPTSSDLPAPRSPGTQGSSHGEGKGLRPEPGRTQWWDAPWGRRCTGRCEQNHSASPRRPQKRADRLLESDRSERPQRGAPGSSAPASPGSPWCEERTVQHLPPGSWHSPAHTVNAT